MSIAYMYVIGVLILGYTYKFNRKLLRISWRAISFWTAFLLLSNLTKYFLFQFPAVQNAVDISTIAYIPWYYMVLAGFEEAMFTLPIYYTMKYTDNKYIRSILISSLAAVFAMGHLYQGLFALIPTFIYMRYVAPKFINTYGFGTMVLGHIIFDLSTWGLVQVLSNPTLLDFSLYFSKFHAIIN